MSALTWDAIKAEAAMRERQICTDRSDYVVCYVHPMAVLPWRSEADGDEWKAAQLTGLNGHVRGAVFALGRVFFKENPYCATEADRHYVPQWGAA